MKLLFAAIALILVQPAHAELYKCSKNGRNVYQAKPCDLDNPDASKVNIKQQSAEQKAQAEERLKQVRSEYDTRKQQKQADAEKQLEQTLKIADTVANQHNAIFQGRQAAAQEIQAEKPATVIVAPNSIVNTSPKP